MEWLVEWGRATLDLTVRAAPYLLFGFLAAGFIRVLIPTRRLADWLGGDRWTSVARAALIGVPLPLCSCAVVPVAAALRRRGASRGATSAFLIATPESGVDSIAVTYALIDPIMTITRPVAAFFTAFVAGIAQNLLSNRRGSLGGSEATAGDSRCGGDPAPPGDRAWHGRDSAGASMPGGRTGESCQAGNLAGAPQTGSGMGGRSRLGQRLRDGWRYAFMTLFDDLAGYLVVGFLVAGVLSVLLTRVDLLRAALESPWAMVLMVVAGTPMYVCAAAATPMVAVMIYQGLSPGAGLVFLLVGPATNAASVALLYRILGRRAVVVYLASIIGSALLLGVGLDLLYPALGVSPRASLRAAESVSASWFSTVCGAALFLLVVWALWRRFGPCGRGTLPPVSESIGAG